MKKVYIVPAAKVYPVYGGDIMDQFAPASAGAVQISKKYEGDPVEYGIEKLELRNDLVQEAWDPDKEID